MQVRQRIARMLPVLRLASEKYVALVLDKRRTLVLVQRAASASIRNLPEASESIIDNASGAPPLLPPLVSAATAAPHFPFQPPTRPSGVPALASLVHATSTRRY